MRARIELLVIPGPHLETPSSHGHRPPAVDALGRSASRALLLPAATPLFAPTLESNLSLHPPPPVSASAYQRYVLAVAWLTSTTSSSHRQSTPNMIPLHTCLDGEYMNVHIHHLHLSVKHSVFSCISGAIRTRIAQASTLGQLTDGTQGAILQILLFCTAALAARQVLCAPTQT